MLPKNQRLKKKGDIDRVFREGKTIRAPHIICKFKENNLGLIRPCFTSARNLKLNTVKKNRLKRQMVNAYKQALLGFPETIPPYDAIFILTQIPQVNSKRFQVFYTEISQCLKKF